MILNGLWSIALADRSWLRYVAAGAFTLLSVLIVGVLWRRLGAIPDPGLILLLTVAASTYLAGGMAGMLSAAIVLFGSFVLFSHPLYPFRYSELDWRQMMAIVITCPVIALMVGSLKDQVERLRAASRELPVLRDEIRRLEAGKEAQFQSEQRFQTLVDCLADHAVCTLDAGGAVTSWNPGAERFFGYHDPEIVGQSYSRFFSKQDLLAKHPERLIEQARFSGRVDQEGWWVRKGGGRMHARTSIILLRNSLGAPAGYLLVIRDLTELEEARAAVLKAQAEFDAIKDRGQPPS